MGLGQTEAIDSGKAATANVVRMAQERAAAASIAVGDPVMVRWVDEYGPAWVVEEGESIVEWLRVRPADGGKVVMVCRDQCRRPTKAEVQGYGLDRAPRASGRKSA
ncbi:MAG: hypothetical protein IT433_13460 [Phycisphaerales bacterium]|nr:hypothetical protein [Phycisphaerales bacterium]